MSGSVFRVYWDAAARVAAVEWQSKTACSLAEAESATTQVRALADGAMLPLLVDMRGMTSMDRPAREHFLNDRGSVSAVALIAESAVNKMIANFFIGLRRMPVPIRLFTDRDAAISWLDENR